MNETKNSRVILHEDGKYRWEYEGSIWKCTHIHITIWKIGAAVISAILLIAALSTGLDIEKMEVPAGVCLFLVLPVFLLTGLVMYLSDRYIYEKKFIADYTMDENEIYRERQGMNNEKAALLAMLYSMFDNNSSIHKSTSEYEDSIKLNKSERVEMKKVRKVKAVPKKDLIIVKQILARCYVYTSDEDFGSVLEFIRYHTADNPKIKFIG